MYSLGLVKILKTNPIKVLKDKSKNSHCFDEKNAGFTLLEIVTVIMLIAVLSLIIAPNWISFINRQQVNKANDIVLSALQEAQREAKKQKRGYSVSFRTNNSIPQIAVYPAVAPKDKIPDNWRNLTADLEMKTGKILLGTNLADVNTRSNTVSYASTDAKTITFDYTGVLDLTVKTKTDGVTAVQSSKIGNGLIVAVAIAKSGSTTEPINERRCVIVKTLLGSVKIGKNTECS